jgi:transcriptional regulator with XRE-family HTH domain
MIYQKIKEIRLLKKLTVAFLSSELKISIANYNDIESGLVDLKLSKIFRIAHILGISSFELFDASVFKFSVPSLALGADFVYLPFSEVCAMRYILKLKEENEILGRY